MSTIQSYKVEESSLFEVYYKDFTSNIKVGSYNINRLPVYKEWTDANGTNRRFITRYQISGSFTIYFDNADYQNEFLTYINNYAKRTDGSVLIDKIYVNNENKAYDNIRAFIDYEVTNYMPYMSTSKYEGFTLTITER